MREGVQFQLDRQAFLSSFKYKGRTFYLIKPTTYMNLSGKAVRHWMNELKIPAENILIVTDDLALPLGKIRMRKKGSDGGHNGLKSIQELLGTNVYPRLRFGIGDQFSKGRQVNFVLGHWKADEEMEVKEKIDICTDAILAFGTIGIDRAKNEYNQK